MARSCKFMSEVASESLIRCNEAEVGQARRLALESVVKYETIEEIIFLEYDDLFTDEQLDKVEDYSDE